MLSQQQEKGKILLGLTIKEARCGDAHPGGRSRQILSLKLAQSSGTARDTKRRREVRRGEGRGEDGRGRGRGEGRGEVSQKGKKVIMKYKVNHQKKLLIL